MVSPTFVAATTTDANGSAVSSLAMDIPSHSNGDMLVICVASTGTGTPATSLTTPSGWSEAISEEAGSSSAVRMTVYYKVGNGSETTVTVAFSTGTGDFASVCCAYSGASGLLDATPVFNAQETGTDIESPSITSTVANTTVIFAYVFDDDLTVEATVADNAGFQGTLRGYSETSGPGNGFAMAMSDITLASIGASGVCDWNTSDSDAGVAVTINITESAASGWSGTVISVSSPGKVNGIEVANITKINGVS